MYIVCEKTDTGLRPYSPILLTEEQANTLKDKLNFQDYWPVRHDNVDHINKWFVILMADYEMMSKSNG